VKAKAEDRTTEAKSLTSLKPPLSRGRRICSGTGTRLSVDDSDRGWSNFLWTQVLLIDKGQQIRNFKKKSLSGRRNKQKKGGTESHGGKM
jgi:hypothetical protein